MSNETSDPRQMRSPTLRLTKTQQQELSYQVADPYTPTLTTWDFARESLIDDIRKGVVSEENFAELRLWAVELLDMDGLPGVRRIGGNILKKLNTLEAKSS